MPVSIADLVIGIGMSLGAVRSLSKAFSKEEDVNLGDDEAYEGEGAPRAKIRTVRNINERVAYIIEKIRSGRDNPNVRLFTVRIVSQKCGKNFCIAERDYWGEVKAVFKAVRERVRYVRDTFGKDTFTSAWRSLQSGGGDCDDASIVIASMLQSLGYPVRLRIIRTTDSPDWNHIFVLVGLPPGNPTKWVSLDASVDKPAGWHAPKSIIANTKDFEVR